MLGNLISDALKSTREGGVLLASRQTQDGLRVEVWDTGIGIAREHLRDIFLEFYKVADHAGTSDGFGLGLAIVARLSHALGHPVSVRSRLGRGWLPRRCRQGLLEVAAGRGACRCRHHRRRSRPAGWLRPMRPGACGSSSSWGVLSVGHSKINLRRPLNVNSLPGFCVSSSTPDKRFRMRGLLRPLPLPWALP